MSVKDLALCLTQHRCSVSTFYLSPAHLDSDSPTASYIAFQLYYMLSDMVCVSFLLLLNKLPKFSSLKYKHLLSQIFFGPEIWDHLSWVV